MDQKSSFSVSKKYHKWDYISSHSFVAEENQVQENQKEFFMD